MKDEIRQVLKHLDIVEGSDSNDMHHLKKAVDILKELIKG